MKRKVPVILSIFLAAGLTVAPTMTANAAPHINPYKTVQAELNFGTKGVEVVTESNGVKAVSGIETGDYFVVKDVDFSSGLKTISIMAKSDKASLIEVRKGGAEGESLGVIKIGNTKGEYKEFSAKMTSIKGSETIAFVGKMGNCAIDSWSAEAAEESTVTPDPGTKPTGPSLDPYNTREAELIFGSSGVEVIEDNGGKVVSGIEAGDYFLVKNVNFKNGLSKISVTAKSEKMGLIEVRTNTPDGELLGSIKISNTNGQYKTFTGTMKNLEGMNNIVFVGKMGNVSVDNWIAEGKKAEETPAPDPNPNPNPNPSGPSVSPYRQVPATLNFGSSGIEIIDDNGTKVVSSFDSGDYFTVKDVNFSEGLALIGVTVKSEKPAIIEVRNGGADGEVLGSIKISNTNGQYKTVYGQMKKVEGKQTITFLGKVGSCTISTWEAKSAPEKPDPQPEDPTPEKPDPQPVDPTPEKPDPQPVDPTPEKPDPQPVDPTPEKPDPVKPDPERKELGLDYTINDWGSGYLVNFTISNKTGKTVDGWKLKLKKSDVNIAQSWCVNITEEGDYYVITPLSWNSTLTDGASIQFGIIGNGASHSTISYTFE